MTKRTDKSNEDIIDSYDYLGGSASVTDCTGLIPAGPTNKAERDSLRKYLPLSAQSSAAPKENHQDSEA